MEIQFQHHHVLTFCDQNKENFSQILFKFFKRGRRNRRKADGDLELAELDDEECAEPDDEKEHAELDGHLEVAELDDEEEHAELDDEEDYAELEDYEESDDEEDYEELDDDEDYAELEVAESISKPSQSQKLKFFKPENFHLWSILDYPTCLVCFRIIDNGPVYFCEMCDGIWVHKFCASLPREIRAHPLHLQYHHSLTLQNRRLFVLNSEKYICDGCRDIIRISNYYECSECGLKLDCKCALSPDNDDLQQISASLSPDTKTQVSHDSHPHTLFLFNPKSVKISEFSSNSCKLCERELLDLTYGCFLCQFYLHKKCVEISQQECEVRQPCHSHHPVSVEYLCQQFICDQCRDLCSGSFMANCKECGFKIDFKCAFLRDTKCALSPYNNDLQITPLLSPDTKTQISHDSHHHTLFLVNSRSRKKWTTCSLCERQIVDLAYCCIHCDFYLHKRCVEITQQECEVQHPCHSHHPVSIQYHPEMFICDQCGDFCDGPFMASCKECGFKIDFKCASVRDPKCALSSYNDDLQITPLLSPDTKTQISHDSHHHTLFLVNSRSRKKWTTCGLCERQIVDLAYCCIHCDFYLHKRCVEITQQECEVQHPCHSHHPVSIQYHREKFICDQCRDLCSGSFMVSCKNCDFKIDFKCAFLRDTTIQRSIGDEVKTQISYVNDLHLLSFFNYTINHLFHNLSCEGCRMPLSGPSYGCLKCSVYLHKSCAELSRIIEHPYHPFHNIFLENSEGYCRACGNDAKSLRYRCYLCPSFSLDTICAINHLGVISALKNKEYHKHDLYYFVAPYSKYQCNICSQKSSGSFYICLECRYYFHMECIGIPKEVKHDSHIHPLTLMGPLPEDDIDESKDQYYCYTCENKRNPRYHAYSCQQCANTGHIFTAHIECVLSTELNEIEHNHMIEEDDEEENNHEKFPDLVKLSISPRCMKQLLIKDKFNDHILNYFEDITSFSCYLCDELVKSPRYECSFCQIHLHKECAKLPFKIKHNLHEHPLYIQGGEFLKRFICDGCQVYHESDMCYHCEECSFSLDRICAQGILSTGNHYRKLNDNESKVEFSHFSHNHKLTFAFIPEKLEFDCSACELLVSGPTYCCYGCYFFLHESCFDKLKPQYIQHPFHIQHPLHFKVKVVICKACRNYSDVGYECAEGDFVLDIKCVKYLTSGLQHKCHEHKLFCFVAEDINDNIQLYQCKHCDQPCSAFFYRCLDCNVNLHIECMSIPKNVKSVCHVHPLTLMDPINEEGRDEYYCHACENLRNPKHAAYYCKKCYYTAHIGCVLDEEDGETEIL